jgi:hypothetical protein
MTSLARQATSDDQLIALWLHGWCTDGGLSWAAWNAKHPEAP